MTWIDPTSEGCRRCELDARLEQIARRVLRIPTLESRGSDRLDMHEVAVWSLREALRAAYQLDPTADVARQSVASFKLVSDTSAGVGS